MFEKNKIFVRWEIELMDLVDLFYHDKKSLETQNLIKVL